MKYNFDMEIDRRNSYSLKWEFMHTGGKLAHTTRFLDENRVLPMWVADMDFCFPKAGRGCTHPKGPTRHLWLYCSHPILL